MKIDMIDIMEMKAPHDDDGERRCGSELHQEKHDEESVVAVPYGVVQPHTVVVHTGNHVPCL